jgi:hypothetical protein
MTCATVAAQSGNVRVLETLHRLGVDLSAPDDHTVRARVAASSHVRTRAHAHTRVRQTSKGERRGGTPASVAAGCKRPAVLDFLRSKGVDITAPTPVCAHARARAHVAARR